METNKSSLHRVMRAIVQTALKREATEPCLVCWTYQPYRPDTPLPLPEDGEKNKSQ